MKTELTDILEKYMNPRDYKLDMCANEILALFNVSGLLFLELAIRCQRELPLHEDELRWWNEETNVFQCGDFTSRLEDEIARVRKNNNR
jgi:hypothetical protein